MPSGSGDESPSGPAVDARQLEVAVRNVLRQEGHVAPPDIERATSQILSLTLASWRGPLPPPAMLREYEAVVPGSAADLVRSFTGEVAHRQAMQRRQATTVLVGLVFGLAGLFGMLGVAAWAIAANQPWVAGAIATALASVAAVFVWRQKPPPGPDGPATTRDGTTNRDGKRDG